MLFVQFSIPSFADELQQFFNQKVDSINAVISNDTTLTEEQKFQMMLDVLSGEKRIQSESGNKKTSDTNVKVIQSTKIIKKDADGREYEVDLGDTQILPDDFISKIAEKTKNSIVSPDTEFRKFFIVPNDLKNAIDTVVKKISCSGGNIVGNSSLQKNDSNLIYIYWAFGLPRKGVYTSCKGGATVAVDYFDGTKVPNTDWLNTLFPYVSDSVIIYAYKKKTTLLIMDAMTGENVFEKIIEPVELVKKPEMNIDNIIANKGEGIHIMVDDIEDIHKKGTGTDKGINEYKE